ncbi:hypothetical protein MN032_10990 [Agromyces atrinae]|uniref:hypothetical protein n=1 Tax=Agromyces atrinae TaxID=592376 RepID=UPI001F58DC1E|nr:hypothetical protein [Agromyces atrinae]MCI2958223.1 hypothetical protein [Agromyces atrinae]
MNAETVLLIALAAGLGVGLTLTWTNRGYRYMCRVELRLRKRQLAKTLHVIRSDNGASPMKWVGALIRARWLTTDIRLLEDTLKDLDARIPSRRKEHHD